MYSYSKLRKQSALLQFGIFCHMRSITISTYSYAKIIRSCIVSQRRFICSIKIYRPPYVLLEENSLSYKDIQDPLYMHHKAFRRTRLSLCNYTILRIDMIDVLYL